VVFSLPAGFFNYGVPSVSVRSQPANLFPLADRLKIWLTQEKSICLNKKKDHKRVGPTGSTVHQLVGVTGKVL
jgi:hypothetical protein